VPAGLYWILQFRIREIIRVIGHQTMPFNQHGEAPKPAQILLVEDMLDLAQVIIRELEATGYSVTHTANGESALQLEKHGHFQLVILDWMLPGMNGLDVLRNLRAHSPVSVLMLTARDAEIDRVLGLEVGADDYLTKPFSMRELIARVRAMLRRRDLIPPARSSFTGLCNDRACDKDNHSAPLNLLQVASDWKKRSGVYRIQIYNHDFQCRPSQRSAARQE